MPDLLRHLTANLQPLADTVGYRLQIWSRGKPCSQRQWLEALAGDELPALMTSELAALPWPTAYWECPKFTQARDDSPFECVVLPAESLTGRRTDHRDFAAYIDDSDGIRCFDNLGGDASLIAPCSHAGSEYGHLLAFCRNAPERQAISLWNALAQEIPSERDRGRHWVSTAGGGVPWLHLRLDTAPKYYRYARYRNGGPALLS